MIAPAAAFKSSRVATTDDYICVPHGPSQIIGSSNTVLASSNSNLVGASVLSSIAPMNTVVSPVVTLPIIAHPPPIISTGLSIGSVINAPLQTLPAVSTIAPIIPISTYQNTAIPTNFYTEPYVGPIHSSRLLIEGPTIVAPITPGRGSIVAQPPGVIVPTCCPECSCCYGLGFGGCCSLSTPFCGCSPAGCYPNCCPPCGCSCNPACCACGPACLDQCCFGICPCNTNCLGCRCFC